MKKFIQILSAAILSMTFMVGVAAAATDQNCDSNINNTGPGSDNSVTCTSTDNVYVQCVNGIYVVDQNSQGANSGDVLVTNNTSGGSGTSGSSSNSNSSNVSIGASCGQTATTTTTTTPTTPTTTTTPQVLGASTTAQVAAPAGGVHAGGGGGVRTSATAVSGLIGSAAVVSLGAFTLIRKRVLGL